MLATSGTVAEVVKELNKKNAKDIIVLSVIASKYGIDILLNTFPKLKIYLAALDNELNKEGYIIPGLGDAGDRLFNN
jgi:uracil phosphoribosyltransferase